MAPHEERVVVEHVELKHKLDRLVGFMANPVSWSALPREDQELLEQQELAMRLYERILTARIARFK